ncbi:MAG TPA: hypothetical protein VEY50_02905 [Lysobacter sp.]|nr:hypothetical protein [Lysobacter sp.]
MSRLHSLPDRALELAHHVSANLKDAMPHAGDWIRTGAALGAVRTGTRVAGGFVRRHPVALATAVVGAGVLWYWARKRAQRAQDAHVGEGGTIQGRSRRVEAQQAGSRRSSASQGARSGRGNGEANANDNAVSAS